MALCLWAAFSFGTSQHAVIPRQQFPYHLPYLSFLLLPHLHDSQPYTTTSHSHWLRQACHLPATRLTFLPHFFYYALPTTYLWCSVFPLLLLLPTSLPVKRREGQDEMGYHWCFHSYELPCLEKVLWHLKLPVDRTLLLLQLFSCCVKDISASIPHPFK